MFNYILIIILFVIVAGCPRNEGHKPQWVDDIKLHFETRIQTPKNSVFYTLIPKSSGFGAYYRMHYAGGELGYADLNDKFDIVKNWGAVHTGEDPRSFYHNSRWYITNNFLNRNAIFEQSIETNPPTLTEVYGPERGDKNFPGGKNPTFISHNGDLYLIKWFYPLTVFKFDKDLSRVNKIHEDTGDWDDKYRGGTPGYSTGKKNEYFGFGHYTITEHGVLKHLIFYWKINLETFLVETKFPQDIKPTSNIMDPVTLFRSQGKLFMVTAESEKSWFEDQDYKNNIWRVELPEAASASTSVSSR